MLLHPADRRQLVVEAEVSVAAEALLDLGVRQIAERTETVVRKYRNDPPRRERRAVKGALTVDAGFKAAAVEKQYDRALLRRLRRVDVQIQTVLAVSKNASLTKLPLVKAEGRILHVLVPAAVLRAGRAEGRRVQLAVPMLDSLGIGKALRPRIGHAQEFETALPLVAAHRAAGGLKPNRADLFIRHASPPLFSFLIIAEHCPACHRKMEMV